MRLRQFSKREILSYKDEDKFVEEVIIPLFEAVSEAAGLSSNNPVKVENWGKDKSRDFGIDVYWGYIDFVRREQHYGMQIKTLPILKRADPNKKTSIVYIENQIREAFNREFDNPITYKSPSKINGFYIITSKKANKVAVDYYRQVIAPYFRNIEILDADDLLYLIKSLPKRLADLKR